ncbi:MAG: tetratricopeptide repeat protein [Acidobacteriota bacterium]
MREPQIARRVRPGLVVLPLALSVIASAREGETEQLLRDAHAAVDARDFDGAIARFTEVIDLGAATQAQKIEAHEGRGSCQLAKGEAEPAIDDFTAALSLGERSATVFVMRATARGWLHDEQGALDDFGEAIRLAPEDATAYYNRGLLEARLGHAPAATADLGRAIELQPDFDAAYANLAKVEGVLSPEKALATLSRGIERKPTALLYFSRASFRAKSDDAISDLGHALELKPDFGEAYANRAIAYTAKKDYEHAVQDLAHAIALMPGVAELHTDRAALLCRLGRFLEGKDELDRAILADPRFASAYRTRGQVLFGLGRFDDAARDLDRYLKQGNPDKYATLALFLARARSGGESAAVLLAYPAADPPEWPDPVADLFRGRVEGAALMAAAAKGDEAKAVDRLCEAHFYLAERALLAGETGSAKEHFQKCVATGKSDFWEYQCAAIALEGLGNAKP